MKIIGCVQSAFSFLNEQIGGWQKICGLHYYCKNKYLNSKSQQLLVNNTDPNLALQGPRNAQFVARMLDERRFADFHCYSVILGGEGPSPSPDPTPL